MVEKAKESRYFIYKHIDTDVFLLGVMTMKNVMKTIAYYGTLLVIANTLSFAIVMGPTLLVN